MKRLVGAGVLLVCLAGLRAAAQESATGGAVPADALQTWLAAHAVPVRSIDPLDEDFRDLEPLVAAIGTARVVQMGSRATARVPALPPRPGS